MKFGTIDEFLAYFYSTGLNIEDVDFVVPDSDSIDAEDPPADADAVKASATPDVIAEPPAEEPQEPTGEKLVESVTLRLASGDLLVQFDKDGYILVDAWEMTPNACGTGSLVIEGRQLHLNMCDMEGTTMAYFHTASGVNQPMKIRRKN